MSPYQWITIIQSVLMIVASIIVWALGRERKALDDKIREIERRMDKAGEQCSDLASDVQSILINAAQIPVELSKVFITKERFEDQVGESRRDREGLWHELSTLRSMLDRRGRREDYGDDDDMSGRGGHGKGRG